MNTRLFQILLLSFLFLFSCKKEEVIEEAEEDLLTEAQIQALDEASGSKIEDIENKGVFKGKINKKAIVLNLQDSIFTATFNGKEAKGKVFTVNDGSVIELQASSGNLPVKYLQWSDSSELIVLDENGEFPEDGEVQSLIAE